MIEHSLEQRIQNITQRMLRACTKVQRSPDTVSVIAASKTHSSALIVEAMHFGIKDFGENYVQELVSKYNDLKGLAVRWHFIGHLQSNKVKAIAPFVDCIHSVDSLRLAEEISKQARKNGRTIEILIQINTSGEHSKSGIQPSEALDLVRSIHVLPGIKVKGLMAIPEPQDDPERTRPEFQLLRRLGSMISNTLSLEGFTELSMGMSSDFECAIEEGATMIRLGTLLFGDREYNQVHS